MRGPPRAAHDARGSWWEGLKRCLQGQSAPGLDHMLVMLEVLGGRNCRLQGCTKDFLRRCIQRCDGCKFGATRPRRALPAHLTT